MFGLVMTVSSSVGVYSLFSSPTWDLRAVPASVSDSRRSGGDIFTE